MSEKTQTAPATPATKEKMASKIPRWLTILFAIWLLWLLVPSAKKMLLAGEDVTSVVKSKFKSVLEKYPKPPQEIAPAMPTITLGCANADNPHDNLPNVKEVVLVVPPLGDCETNWQIRPDGAHKFWLNPDGKLLVQWAFDDGTVGEFHEDNPLARNRVWTHLITAARFKNPTAKTVRVPVYLY